ncbi:DUF7662 domain-containing protein [Catellatospora chokoriensis]|uniref:DUF7662 domain-containing protein n=1 Tax=Catellatospora chokoriensis TaxID=310353 RepID=A0A8J3NX31_9ACTN|nr:hypothetical protein [Catellatospora chokoriensis]GIF93890.1 hypothetical protein Cch02nite_73340 [Catellatospora chokoriensis]
MSKYEALTAHLNGQPADTHEVRMSFTALEQIVGPLPPNARQDRTWWGNTTNPTRVQAQAWQAAGWVVAPQGVSLTAELVVFVRGHVQRRNLGSPVTIGRAVAPADAAMPIAEDQTEAVTQSLLVAYLMREGWRIERTADTASREQGIDVVASRDGRILAVEVKGYPSTSYSDPSRAYEVKPTRPAGQARQWYSHALLKALLTRDAHPTYEIAIGLPDMRTYRLLHERTANSLRELQIRLAFIKPSGEVSWLPGPL